ncbi:S-layer family protein [Thermolongibacillus altinsuensis]|uniref:S-layer family protein n=1 Tax=Thermolongibacillus altinsuensis TaxID=575256 RepID=A0A4R1QFP2_9BACL|nr:S-layer homology domain-containing protein [Thermolongibacillus altinsuensis]TCL49296.1 S-layer family protein [Thermolongibacillus altinsuensis]
MIKKKLFITITLFLLISFTHVAFANAASIYEQFTVTPGVTYQDVRINETNTKKAIRTLKIDLNNPYAKVELGIPNPLTALSSTSAQAKRKSYENHHVVGAVNAAFFRPSLRLPAFLIVENGKIVNLGVISTGYDKYMSVPTAFGIHSNGNAIIDRFSYDASFTVGDVTAVFNSINKQRGENEIILYTPEYEYSSTKTNEYGMEIVVTNLSKSLDHDLTLGEAVTGTVQHVTSYGKGNSTIPKNGCVISIHGAKQAEKFKNIQPGETITITIDVHEPWKNAQFILASGPMLVNNGKVEMTMSENSPQAKTRHPRTAVAIDSSGKKVFFVTVDGRQPGYSDGMTLKEFAQYLVSIGAYKAVNLDGGGSTTMAVRRLGQTYPTVVNSPSDGKERSVSAILLAVSTAPYGQPTYLSVKTVPNINKVTVGRTVDLQINYVLDEHLHPLPFNQANIVYEVEGGIGKIVGNRFIAEKEGKGTIIAKYGKAIAKIPITVEVIRNPNKPVVLLSGMDDKNQWEAESARAKTTIATSKQNEPTFFGKTALKLVYDFRKANGAIAASYLRAKKPIAMEGLPKNIGVWVYGDGKGHWLRGKLIDAAGKVHTIDFTKEGGLTWTGWRYVRAQVPQNVSLPIQLTKIYVAEAKKEKQGTGALYFDKLQAEYVDNYVEPSFNDVPHDFWARNSIEFLAERQIISGYNDGSFRPNDTLTRAHAAIFLARALKIAPVENSTVAFHDVPRNHPYYPIISAVVSKGIMNGKKSHTFDPNGTLTRAQMAAILTRAYKLSGIPEKDFSDVPKSFWAYKEISALAANGIAKGSNSSFRPNDFVTRAQFSELLARTLKSVQ